MTTKETLCTLDERLTALVRDWEKARQEGDDDRKFDLNAEITRCASQRRHVIAKMTRDRSDSSVGASNVRFVPDRHHDEKWKGERDEMAGKGNVRFVQFPHPGEEHEPDVNGEWNSCNLKRLQHGRKFLQSLGAWVEEESGNLCRGDVWTWAEWEAEARRLRCFEGSKDGKPCYLWEPTWTPGRRYPLNTDPFIFGGFYYTDCKQDLPGLQQLDKGSIIVFGSELKRSRRWVVDTVFVVSGHDDINSENYEERLAGRVPDCYWDVVQHPTFGDPSVGCGGPTKESSGGSKKRRFYEGATHGQVDGRDPVDGMFSFFPCLPASKKRPFARPHIELPKEFFTKNLSQGAKGHKQDEAPLPQSTVKELWHSIVEQVRDQGLLLGVEAKPPEPSSR